MRTSFRLIKLLSANDVIKNIFLNSFFFRFINLLRAMEVAIAKKLLLPKFKWFFYLRFFSSRLQL